MEQFQTCCHKLNGRNLVVCIDGTSNQFGDMNTNVIELYNLILKEDSSKQRTWYNSGIGTYARPSWASLGYYKKVLHQTVDLAIAWDFERTILGAYHWLSDNYEDGDRIFLFGFSRGAYQVRVLSAMIDKVGLIHKGNEMQIPFAFELYADPSSDLLTAIPTGSQRETITKAQRFKNTFSRKNVIVHFVGVWDTVSSIGLARGTLPRTVDGMKHVCHFRHALALDERRVKFLPEYAYGGRAGDKTQKNNDDSQDPKEKTDPDLLGKKDSSPQRPQTLEVWFAGTHSDIGGGNVENQQMDRSRPPLRWMVFEAQAAGLYMAPFNRDLSHEELIEVQESLTWHWRPLEILPFPRLTFTKKEAEKDQFTWMPHLGEPRQVLPGQKIHSSLLLSKEVYLPQAYSPNGDSSFWKSLRKDEDLKRKWVEFDLYEYTEGVISHCIGDPGKVSHILNSIAASSEGRKAVIEALKRNNSPVHEEAKCRILAILVEAAHQNPQSNSQFKRCSLSEIQHVVADLLKTKQHQQTAKEFIMWFTDRCINTLQGHKAQVNCVAFSPNGKRLASASVDYSVRIWSVETWSQTHRLSGHLFMVSSVAFCIDSRHVVSGSWDKSLRVWDAESGKQVGELNGHEAAVTSVAVSSDGKQVVSGSRDRTVRLWNLGNRQPVNGPFRGQTDSIQSVSFSPNGKFVASGSNDNTTHIWDLQTGDQMGNPHRMHRDSVTSVSFSPDGRHVASGSADSKIQIFDPRTGALKGERLSGHEDTVWCVVFSPDGKRLASASADNTVRIWDVETGKPLGLPLQGHKRGVRSVTFSPDGKWVVSGSSDHTIRIWDSGE